MADDKPTAAEKAADKTAAADATAAADRAAEANADAVAAADKAALEARDQAAADREEREARAEESRAAAADALAAYDSPPDSKGPQYVPAAGSDPDSQQRLGKMAEAAGVVVDWDATYARAEARADGKTTAAERRAAATSDADRARPPRGRSTAGQSNVTGPGKA